MRTRALLPVSVPERVPVSVPHMVADQTRSRGKIDTNKHRVSPEIHTHCDGRLRDILNTGNTNPLVDYTTGTILEEHQAALRSVRTHINRAAIKQKQHFQLFKL